MFWFEIDIFNYDDDDDGDYLRQLRLSRSILSWEGQAHDVVGLAGLVRGAVEENLDGDVGFDGNIDNGDNDDIHNGDKEEDDGDDCLVSRNASSGHWREGSGLGSPVGGTGGTPVHWVVSSILLCIINHITIWLAIQMVHLLCYQI